MTDFTEDDLDRLQQKPRPKGKLPWLPEGEDLDALAVWLTLAFRPPAGFRFDSFVRAGRRPADPCSITFRNGRDRRTFRFRAQSDLHGRKLRQSVYAVSDGWLRMPHLTETEQEDVWAGLCTHGRVMSETDDRDEARKWVQHLLDQAAALRGHTLVPDGRHDALMALRAVGEFRAPDARGLGQGADTPRRPTRFVDKQTGEQYVRAGETFAFVKWVEGAERLDQAGLRARLSDIGVESFHFEDYRPPHPKLTLYRLTDEFLDYLGAAK